MKTRYTSDPPPLQARLRPLVLVLVFFPAFNMNLRRRPSSSTAQTCLFSLDLPQQADHILDLPVVQLVTTNCVTTWETQLLVTTKESHLCHCFHLYATINKPAFSSHPCLAFFWGGPACTAEVEACEEGSAGLFWP